MKNFVIQLLVVALVQWSSVKCQDAYIFNCERDGAVCQNGAQCDWGNTRKCLCVGAFTGYDCSEPTGATACDDVLSCGSGVCWDTGSGPVCYCNEGWIPDVTTGLCVERIRYTDCTATLDTPIFDIEVTPYTGFSGYIYFAGTTDAACYLQDGGTGIYTKAVTDIWTPACDASVVFDFDADVDMFYTMSIIIQHDVNSIASSDYLATLACMKALILGPQSRSLTTATTYSLNQAAGYPQLTSSTDSETGLTVSIRLDGGGALTGPQEVGVAAEVLIQLDQSYGFTSFLLNTLTAWDGTMTNPKVFVQSGCAQRGALSLMDSMVPTTTPGFKSVLVDFKTFKFTGSDTIKFVANVLFCDAADDTAGACDPVTCAGPTDVPNVHPSFLTGSGRRRRRQVVTGPSVEKSLDVTYFVVSSASHSTEVDVSQFLGEAKPCHQNLAFMLPLILLCVLLVVVMVAAIYFCLRVQRKN